MKLRHVRHAIHKQLYNKGYSQWSEYLTTSNSRVSTWVGEFGDCIIIEFKFGSPNTRIQVISDANTDIFKVMKAKTKNLRAISICLSRCLRHVERRF